MPARDPRLVASRAQERRGARLHGGTLNAASGALPTRKGDVRVSQDTRDAVIEYKTTVNQKQITIKGDDLELHRYRALSEGRQPVFGIEVSQRDWVLLEAAEYETMCQQLRDAGLR